VLQQLEIGVDHLGHDIGSESGRDQGPCPAQATARRAHAGPAATDGGGEVGNGLEKLVHPLPELAAQRDQKHSLKNYHQCDGDDQPPEPSSAVHRWRFGAQLCRPTLRGCQQSSQGMPMVLR
jgi:hypothetical protein